MRFDEFVAFRRNTGIRVSVDRICHYPFHLHSDVIELVAVLYGSVRVSDCAMDHLLVPGELYIFNPNDPHRLESDGDNGVLTVQIKRSQMAGTFPELKDAYFVCQPMKRETGEMDPQLRELRHILAELLREYDNPDGGEYALVQIGQRLVRTLLMEFTSYTYRKGPNGDIEIVRAPEKSGDDNPTKRDYHVVDLIYRQFREKLTLEEMAAQMYVSPAHLSRSIKKTVGLTFSEILSLARSEEAERLLFTTSKTVDEIADQVGFANRKHLAINFKKWYKKTPTEFRNALRNDQCQRQLPRLEKPEALLAKNALESWEQGK